MKYTHLLIDMDGTLFDFNSAEKAALIKTCSYLGCEYSSDLHIIYHNINLSVWKDYEQGKMTQHELQEKRFLLFQSMIDTNRNNRQVNNYYQSQLEKQNQLLPGALETVQQLYNRNCKLYIATNGTSSTQRKRFFSTPLSNYFIDIYISEEIGFQKPKTEFFNYCIGKINADKKDILMIGDSLTSDILGGYQSGIDTCYINPTSLVLKNEDIKPTYIIPNISQLLDIIFSSPPC